MQDQFIITDIKRVILVGKDEYKEAVTSFTANQFCRNELIFNLSGESVVRFNGKCMRNTPDTIRFLPQGEIREYVVERLEGGECIDVFFDTDVPVSQEAFTVKIHQSEKLRNLFRKIFSVWVAKDEGYYFECISILYKIFAELQKTNYIPESQFHAIKPAIGYIEEHFFEKKITAEELTACCSVSYPYIKKLFVKKFGMPPIRYSIQLKINYACDLLRSGRYTVSQTAEICGYKDISFFSRQFKDYMGIAPATFLEKYKSSK